MKKISHANHNQKRVRVAILTSDKIDFKLKSVRRDKKGHYIVVKAPLNQKNIAIMNIYVLNIGTPKYLKQILT